MQRTVWCIEYKLDSGEWTPDIPGHGPLVRIGRSAAEREAEMLRGITKKAYRAAPYDRRQSHGIQSGNTAPDEHPRSTEAG
jgi:hypothetical protein